MLSDLRLRLRALFRKDAMEAEMDDELRFHLEQQREKHMRSGMTPNEAMRRAQIEFGGASQVREEWREARGIHTLETLWQDVRYSLRTLAKNRGFTFVALLTLGLGIGANTAIYSVVYGVLLRPLPYTDPARLVVLNETTPAVGMVSVSYPNFVDWRAQSRSFSAMAVVTGVEFNLAGIGQPEHIAGQAVSTNFLSMMGVRPLLGRDFDTSEEKPGAGPVVMLSYQLWQSHFGGERNAVGRTITLNGKSFDIVAVLPPDFRLTESVDVIQPIGVYLTDNGSTTGRGNRGETVVIGRLAPGIDLSQARTEMEGIAARLSNAYPDTNNQFGVHLQPIREVFVSGIRPAILVLLGAVMFVLLIACANVANLTLMRSAGRTREIAVRMAIGATRGRIVRQMLVESLVLAFAGGMFGLALAAAGIRGIVQLVPAGTLGGASVDLNGAVLLFAAGATILAAAIFGLAPSVQSARSAVQSRLREGGRSNTAGAGQHRWRSALVVAEISLSVVLLAGAGLMLRSLGALLSVDGGFQPDRVLTMAISLLNGQYTTRAKAHSFWQEVIERVRALPGVQSAALGTLVPLTNSHARADITIEGMPLPKPGSFPHPDVHTVSPDYVRTIGARIIRGREFTAADHENSPRVGMINARLAREYFPNEDPIGKRFMMGRPSPDRQPNWMTIVGVVADTRLYGLANPSRLEIYRPYRQTSGREMNLVVKSAADPSALTRAIREVVSSIDREQPVFAVATMEQLVRESVGDRRITLILLGLFSALALALAAIGIYGVISYSVAQRTQEIGIRMALGARQQDVLRMVLAQGGRIAAAGVLIGLAAAFGLTRLLEKLLFGVSPNDPATFVAVAILLAAVAMLACYIPARRTLRVDPAIALRYE